MSVQLKLKPQFYDGYGNDISVISGEMIANGFFQGINTLAGITNTSNNPVPDIITNFPPASPNTWYRFRQNAGTTMPTLNASNQLELYNSPSVYLTGIYQEVNNLVVGEIYTVTITLPLSLPTNSTIFIGMSDFSGNEVQSVIYTPGTGILTVEIIPDITNPIIFLYSTAFPGTETITIGSISISGTVGFLETLVGDGQVICDLYEDEDLPLTLSVEEFKDVAENVQSYSKAFKLPGTKRNNRIFDYMFEVTRAYDGYIFSPYRKTKCILEQDGFTLFEGYLRLIDVSDKNGEISYNVNLYSEVIALSDVLADRNFSNLGFTELEHVYNIDNIKKSWNTIGDSIIYTNPSTSGFRDAYDTLKYPFINWNSQISKSNGTLGVSGNPVLSNLECAFRPFIQLKYLIDRIFNAPATPFTYTSVFFNTGLFKDLYMDFNWGSREHGAAALRNDNLNRGWDNTSGSQPSQYVNGLTFSQSTSYLNLNLTISGNDDLWSSPPYFFQSDVNNLQVSGSYYIVLYNQAAGARSNELKVSRYDSNDILLEDFYWNVDSIPSEEYKIASGDYDCVLNEGDYIQVRAIVISEDVIIVSNTFPSNITFEYDNQGATVENLLDTSRGDVGQWEFLKGLFTMFNLVSVVDQNNPNNIIIEPYDDIFVNNSESKELNWTDKIDISEMKLTPLTDLNSNTIFQFVEDKDDYAAGVYKGAVGRNYGSYESDATDEFNILTGMKEITAEPFASSVIKPLDPLWADIITPAIYAMDSEGVCEAFENSPRILYNNGKKITAAPYYVPAQNAGAIENNLDTYLQFSHLTTIPSVSSTTITLNFEDWQLVSPSVGSPCVNNLFFNYWQNYFNQLYNPDTRMMSIKVNLTSADINTFSFSDFVFIKNRRFRVNKINYNPNQLSKVEFILIP
tara:strand:- start:371 stop:3094 length:2724 start_codon:yes stop_codon:yes gene_type:complete